MVAMPSLSPEAPSVQGCKYIQRLGPLLEQLHAAGTERDRAGNRQLFYEQSAALRRLYFCNPTLTRLRSLPPASQLAQVQQR